MPLAPSKGFPILTILPKRQAPCGQSVPQASGAPPSSALQLACNGLGVPPPPTESPGRGKLGRLADLRAPRLSHRTPGPRLAAYVLPGQLTSAARGGWLCRQCAPNMAAAVEAAHVRSAEGGRADERERARKARRRLPAAPRRCRCLLQAGAENPRPPHPTLVLTRFTPTLRKGRGKRRGTSLPASGTPRLPQSSAATALVRGGSRGSSQRTRSRESSSPPTSGLHPARAESRPLPGARTTLPFSAAVVVL